MQFLMYMLLLRLCVWVEGGQGAGGQVGEEEVEASRHALIQRETNPSLLVFKVILITLLILERNTA